MATFQILSFDGGGIRGAFGTALLETFEEKLGRPIADYFDLVAGTSTYFPHQVMPDGDAYCDGALWAIDPAILAVAEAFKIRQHCTRPKCDPSYDTSTIQVLSIGTGSATYSLSPPGSDAGALYWAPRVADVMTTPQVPGVQSPLEYLLGDRYQKINFDLPDNTWTLDNTSRIPDLFELGRKAGEDQFDRVAETFFAEPKSQEFVPYGSPD